MPKINIHEEIASAIGRRDEVPNIELAIKIIANNDTDAVRDLVELAKGKNKNASSDCIKTLYEIGERKPALIADYYAFFLELLDHKNNRIVWGAMMALDYISSVDPKNVFTYLNKILSIADQGSVITKDHAVGILINFCKVPEYLNTALPILLEMLKTAAGNQLPKYAENTLPVVSSQFNEQFITILHNRVHDAETESKRKRIEKVIAKASKAKHLIVRN
jgi:hypothetical protein